MIDNTVKMFEFTGAICGRALLDQSFFTLRIDQYFALSIIMSTFVTILRIFIFVGLKPINFP